MFSWFKVKEGDLLGAGVALHEPTNAKLTPNSQNRHKMSFSYPYSIRVGSYSRPIMHGSFKKYGYVQWLRTSRKTRLSIGSWLASSIQTRSDFQFRAAEKNGIQLLSGNYVGRTDYSILESLQIENIVSVWLLPVLSELKCSSINSRESRFFDAPGSCWKFWCMNNRRRCERTGFRPILCCAVGTPCVPSAELPIDRAPNRSPSLSLGDIDRNLFPVRFSVQKVQKTYTTCPKPCKSD